MNRGKKPTLKIRRVLNPMDIEKDEEYVSPPPTVRERIITRESIEEAVHRVSETVRSRKALTLKDNTSIVLNQSVFQVLHSQIKAFSNFTELCRNTQLNQCVVNKDSALRVALRRINEFIKLHFIVPLREILSRPGVSSAINTLREFFSTIGVTACAVIPIVATIPMANVAVLPLIAVYVASKGAVFIITLVKGDAKEYGLRQEMEDIREVAPHVEKAVKQIK